MSLKPVAVLIAVFVALAAGSVRADDRTVLRVKVPFDFVAAGEVLPSGTYDIREGSDGSAMWIEGEQRHPVVAVVLTTQAGGLDPAGDQPSLVFTRHENHLQLAQIWLSDHDGRNVAGSSRLSGDHSTVVTVK
jgi:hypothetical protein